MAGRATKTRPSDVPPDARRRRASSPHPCRTYGVARPADRLNSTALGRRSDKPLMAVLGHLRRMRNGLVIRPTLVLGATSPLISLTWGPRAPPPACGCPTAMVGATPRPAVHHDHRGPDVLAEWLASYRVTRVGWSRPSATGRRSGTSSMTTWSAGCSTRPTCTTSLGVIPTTPMRPGLPSWPSTAGQPPARRHLRQAGRNVPFDPLCAAYVVCGR